MALRVRIVADTEPIIEDNSIEMKLKEIIRDLFKKDSDYGDSNCIETPFHL